VQSSSNIISESAEWAFMALCDVNTHVTRSEYFYGGDVSYCGLLGCDNVL
jgi:hypothetical protein